LKQRRDWSSGLPGSTAKKVSIQRFDREPLHGFVNPLTYLQAEGVELLSPSGELTLVPFSTVKVVFFVRDFDLSGAGPARKVFTTRPKLAGLWVRIRLRDGDLYDGILPNDLLQCHPQGFTLTPPDAAGNHQRFFVPRAAISAIEVLGVVSSPLTRKKPKQPPAEQIGLFDSPEPPDDSG